MTKDRLKPKYLYHWSPKENRESIIKNGLIGNHNGGWGIYLAENPKSWERENYDLYKVSTENLRTDDFYSVDENLDEVIYWGKSKGKIRIPISEIKLIKEIKEKMIEYKTFDDYVRSVFKLEITELTHISPEEQKKKTVKITADELINIWNELTELEKENAELKTKLEALEGQTPWKDIKDKSEVVGQLTKAKEIIKRFSAIRKTPYLEGEEELFAEAEQFLNGEV